MAMYCSGSAMATVPHGYYDDCENKMGGKTLLKALHQTISDHDVVSYSGLWNVYLTSDIDENGKIWDMYSTKRWTPSKEQCGNYHSVGDCYNREHSMPKSWFDDKSPMVSDAFHIYPTDGKVNGQRSNYPYGECSGGMSEPSNGSVKALGKLGTCTFPGYSGTVFEPDDEYKGDFARSYFYMAACYNDKISGWKSDMLAKNDYPCYTSWAVDLLLKWHRQDPVSRKELDRNDAVYAYQGNRNPFIDHPELAEYVWGTKTSERWTSKAGNETPVDPIDPVNPVDPVDPIDPIDPVDPTPTDGEGSLAEPYSCTQVIETEKVAASAWVCGYIVGAIDGNDIEASTSVTTNLAIADSKNAIEKLDVIPVQLPNKSEIQNALNLKEHPDFVGKKIILLGRLTTYFGQPGMKDITDYRWVEEPDDNKDDDQHGKEDSGIYSAKSEDLEIITGDGVVEVIPSSAIWNMTISSVDGLVWFAGPVAETQQFSLPAGIYIFRTPETIHRILVK